MTPTAAGRSRATARSSLRRVAEEETEQDLARRMAELSAAMDETARRQEELQRKQAALLDQLERLNRAQGGKDEPEA